MAHQQSENVRVRLPGKFIVLPTLAAAIVVFLGVKVASNFSSNSWENEASLETVKVGKAHYVQLPDFLVDLSPDQQGRTAYLKLSASIAIEKHDTNSALQKISDVQPHIIERTTFFLRELQPEDFQGSAGMLRIKKELLRRVNLVLAPVEVDDVIINDLVIQ